MRYSKLLGKTVRTVPSSLRATSHKLLHQGGFIRQISAGRYAFLPLGYRVWQNIYRIIKQEMDSLGAQQLVTPTLHPIEFWQKTHRDKAFGDEMMVLDDHHGATFAVGATAEGMMVELVKEFSPSYKDLPIVIYQFSNKFRDEKRPRGGLLRVREFMMKDAYSFTATEEESLDWYQKFYDAYLQLAEKFDLKAVPSLSVSGAIGGDYNYEFMVEAAVGEGVFFVCACGEAFTDDYLREKHSGSTSCPQCGGALSQKAGIEWGHIFKQDHFYTQPHEGFFVDKDGRQKPLWMGAYGIGIGRTMAMIVETHSDSRGIIWPSPVAPFKVHLIAVNNQQSTINNRAAEIYRQLKESGVEVLFDDRVDVSAGAKFADADLIGCPYRVVVSKKTLAQGGVEVKKRGEAGTRVVPLGELMGIWGGPRPALVE